MVKNHLSRKLAVILHADVVGSTTLVQQNETLAHERIQATFRNFSETIKSYGGMTRELRGDALVAEFGRAYKYACKAVKFDDTNIMGLYALAEAFYLRGEHERAVIEIDRAIEHNPNDYHNMCSKGEYLTFSGQFEAGMQCSLDAMSTNPLAADNCLKAIGIGEYLSGNFDQALVAFSKVKRNSLFKLGSIAACYAQLGRTVEAARVCKDFFTLVEETDAEIESWKDYWSRTCPFRDPDDQKKILSGMQMAGIPISIES